jgi:hypothetical protein
MSEIKTGGPAFPQGIDQGASGAGFPIVEITGGLTIWDHFAGQALQGLLANRTQVTGMQTVEDVVSWVKVYADSMIKAREVKE